MIDWVKLQTEVEDPEKITSLFKDCQTVSDYRTGEVIKYSGKVGDLYCTLQGKRLTVKNSLHKDFHGNNAGIFTYIDLVQEVEKLSNLFQLDFTAARISQFEFAVNLNVELAPKLYLDEMIGFKGKGIHKFDRGYKGYQLVYNSENYKFKIYDKSREGKIKNLNILRFEIKRREASRYLPQFKVINDLLNEQAFEQLGKELMNFFDKIEFKQDRFGYRKGMKPADIILLEALNNSGQVEILSKLKRYCSAQSYYSSSNRLKKLIKREELCKTETSIYLRKELVKSIDNIMNN